jgi:hypothetical protein
MAVRAQIEAVAAQDHRPRPLFSLATFTAIRRTSCLVISLAADRDTTG